MTRDEDFGPIEQEITKEEPKEAKVDNAKPKSLPKIFSNIPKLALFFKKPKIATIAILVLSIVVIYFALSLIGQKPQEENTIPNAAQTLPSPETSEAPSLNNIAQRVDTYSKKIDALENYAKSLTKPIVDLEIDFEK